MYNITYKAPGTLRVYRERDTEKALALFISLAKRPEPQDKDERTRALAAFSNEIVMGLATEDYYHTYVIDERVVKHPKNVPTLPRAGNLTIRREGGSMLDVRPDEDKVYPTLQAAPDEYQGQKARRKRLRKLSALEVSMILHPPTQH